MPTKPPKSRDSKTTPESSGQSGHLARNIREIVESVAIAFVLAFLFRTFEAEAFVIPTGSMAPTLMGRHKDVECPQCGNRYQASASHEDTPQAQAWRANRSGDGQDDTLRYGICHVPDLPVHDARFRS